MRFFSEPHELEPGAGVRVDVGHDPHTGKVTVTIVPGRLQAPPGCEPGDFRPLRQRLRDYQRNLVKEALLQAGGNVSLAAERLHEDRRNFFRRVQKLGLRLDEIRTLAREGNTTTTPPHELAHANEGGEGQ